MIQKRKLILAIPVIVLSIIVYAVLAKPSPPETAELELYLKAAEAYDCGDLISTIELTSALSEKCPAFFQARLLLGKAQFFSGRISEAKETFENLINDKNNYYEAELWNLRSKIQTENTREARIYGEELLSRSSDDPRILGMLARISTLEDNYQQAIELYKRAMLFEEELAINRVDAAKIYFSLLNTDEATIQLDKAAILAAEDSPLRPALINLINTLGENE